MKIALETAQESGDDIPVGAVIVKDNKIIAQCHNEKEARKDVSAHAEILALSYAAKIMGDWRLNGCDMYVTLEPCPMCAWAILNARAENLYFGSYDNIYGAFSCVPSLYRLSKSKMNFKGGIMEKECDLLLKSYFERLR